MGVVLSRSFAALGAFPRHAGCLARVPKSGTLCNLHGRRQVSTLRRRCGETDSKDGLVHGRNRALMLLLEAIIRYRQVTSPCTPTNECGIAGRCIEPLALATACTLIQRARKSGASHDALDKVFLNSYVSRPCMHP